MWDNALRTSNTFDMEANELIILVVEDDEPSFLYLKTILKQIPAVMKDGAISYSSEPWQRGSVHLASIYNPF